VHDQERDDQILLIIEMPAYLTTDMFAHCRKNVSGFPLFVESVLTGPVNRLDKSLQRLGNITDPFVQQFVVFGQHVKSGAQTLFGGPKCREIMKVFQLMVAVKMRQKNLYPVRDPITEFRRCYALFAVVADCRLQRCALLAKVVMPLNPESGERRNRPVPCLSRIFLEQDAQFIWPACPCVDVAVELWNKPSPAGI